MPRTASNKVCNIINEAESVEVETSSTSPQTNIIEGQSSQGGEFIELKVRSREEDILRKLGIVHLEHKATRARYTADESSEAILKAAGVRYFNTAEYEEAETKARVAKKEKELREKLEMKPLSRRKANILKTAGVTWLENMSIVEEDDDDITNASHFQEKLGRCETGTTATTSSTTLGGSTINSTYAERELLRRLKRGWSSTGEECEECGMPIICKSKRGDGLLECVICGVVGEADNRNHYDIYEPNDVDVGPGVFHVGATISTITEQFDTDDQSNYDRYHCHECQAPLADNANNFGGENQGMYCDSCAEKSSHHGSSFKEYKTNDENDNNDDDDVYKEELGLRLFDGWELKKLNCPSCNLPLISEEGGGAASICLRCG